MRFEEVYAKFKKASFGDEDFEQDCVVLFLENPEADVSEIIKTVQKKRTMEYFDKKKFAPNLYDEKGECFTDDIYFVEPDPTAEVNETNNITDEIREQGLKIARLMRTTAVLWRQTTKTQYEVDFTPARNKKACVFWRKSVKEDVLKVNKCLSMMIKPNVYLRSKYEAQKKLLDLKKWEMKKCLTNSTK